MKDVEKETLQTKKEEDRSRGGEAERRRGGEEKRRRCQKQLIDEWLDTTPTSEASVVRLQPNLRELSILSFVSSLVFELNKVEGG